MTIIGKIQYLASVPVNALQRCLERCEGPQKELPNVVAGVDIAYVAFGQRKVESVNSLPVPKRT